MPFLDPNNSNFTAITATTGAAPLTVTFQPDQSRGFYPISDQWDFGDTGTGSATDTGFLPIYTIQRTYTVPGVYSVTLTGTAPFGTPNPSTFTQTNYITVFNSTATPTSGPAPLTVAFSGAIVGAATYLYNVTIVFGNGSPNFTLAGGPGTTVFNTNYTYPTAGTYSAVMTYYTDVNNIVPIVTNFNIVVSAPVVVYGGGSFKGVNLRGLRIGKPLP